MILFQLETNQDFTKNFEFDCATRGAVNESGSKSVPDLCEDRPNCVTKKQWISHDEMMNITVISESTPGPIAINCATYIGYKQKGIGGAIAATIGMALPSFCIIFLISMFLDRFLEIRWIANAFRGIKLAVGILILDAAIRMIRKMPKKPFTVVIAVCAFAAMLLVSIFSVRVTSITLMLIAALIGLIAFLIAKRKEGDAG